MNKKALLVCILTLSSGTAIISIVVEMLVEDTAVGFLICFITGVFLYFAVFMEYVYLKYKL